MWLPSGAEGLSADRLVRLARQFVVTDGRGFRIANVDPGDTHGFPASKPEAEALLKEVIQQISKLQETLYADNRWSVLLMFQAMDAAGKDSAIEHVFSGVNPQGMQMFAFKPPSAEELDHTFLWRTSNRTPERGRIGVHNRSHYEEVLVVRVHPELLTAEKLPEAVVTRRIWDERLDDIKAFERHLARNGCVIRKFFLHISKEEQARRFLARLEEPAKRWKFSMGDIRDRERWDDYMHAYEEAIRRTAAPDAPWVVIPGDRKWFARLVIAGAVLDALRGLKLRPPAVSSGREQELEAVRMELEKSVGKRESRKKKRKG